MGEKFDVIGRKTDGSVDKEVGGTAGKRTADRSPTPADTTTATAGGTDGGSRTDIGGTAEKRITVPKADELSVLTEEERQAYMTADESEQKRILRNAKRRERYAQQKQASGQEVKPRKVKQNKKSETTAFDVTQLNLIIAGVSTAVASRPNCEHWLLTPEEINSITVPLSKMLAESETFANMGQYSNQIALVMACLTVFGPRLFITVQKTKEVKRVERTKQHTDTNVRDTKNGAFGKAKTSNSDNHRTNGGGNKKSDDNHDDSSILLYGVPLA